MPSCLCLLPSLVSAPSLRLWVCRRSRVQCKLYHREVLAPTTFFLGHPGAKEVLNVLVDSLDASHLLMTIRRNLLIELLGGQVSLCLCLSLSLSVCTF